MKINGWILHYHGRKAVFTKENERIVAEGETLKEAREKAEKEVKQ